MNELSNYQGKKILVTGASSRIGYSIADYLLERGAVVYINYRKDLEGASKLLENKERKGILVQADVSSEEDVAKMFSFIQARTDNLDGLINVVGEYCEGPTTDIPANDWHRMFRSNLDSVFYTMQSLYPLLKKSDFPRVINFAYSNADRVVASARAAYHISKMGVLTLSKTLAKEWGTEGITVNVISPGTMFNSVTMESDNPKDYIPVGRFGLYEDIFPVIDQIFRPDSTYLTGNNFVLSGGYNI